MAATLVAGLTGQTIVGPQDLALHGGTHDSGSDLPSRQVSKRPLVTNDSRDQGPKPERLQTHYYQIIWPNLRPRLLFDPFCSSKNNKCTNSLPAPVSAPPELPTPNLLPLSAASC